MGPRVQALQVPRGPVGGQAAQENRARQRRQPRPKLTTRREASRAGSMGRCFRAISGNQRWPTDDGSATPNAAIRRSFWRRPQRRSVSRRGSLSADSHFQRSLGENITGFTQEAVSWDEGSAPYRFKPSPTNIQGYNHFDGTDLVVDWIGRALNGPSGPATSSPGNHPSGSTRIQSAALGRAFRPPGARAPDRHPPAASRLGGRERPRRQTQP